MIEVKDQEYIKKFWVGLMDGDGSIQVNHWRKKSFQYRLVIKLKNIESNYIMLNIIRDFIGGKVLIVNNNIIIWFVNARKEVYNIIKIFDEYPPLTHRLRLQLAFLLECKTHNNITLYLETRSNKYLKESLYINYDNVKYFKEWLSGFIEAKGCFCLRKKGNHSFSLSQLKEKTLIEYVRQYFDIQSQLRNPVKDFWFIETYRRSSFLKIIEHFDTYPLLGQKKESFYIFKESLKSVM